MRVLLVLGLGVLALALTAACSGDSNGNATATLPSASSTEPVTNPTRSRESQSTPTPEPTEEPFARLTFVPVDRSAPLEQTGGYLMDMDTLELWYIGRGGYLSPDGTAIATTYCCLGDGSGVDIMEIPSGDLTTIPVAGDVTVVRWAPDSQQLAIIGVMPSVSQPDSERALYLVNRDGSSVRKVAPIEAERPWLDVRWLDEETVLVVDESLDDPEEVVRTYFRVDVSTDTVEVLSISNPPTSGDPRILTGERAPDGRWVAYENHGLYVWDAVNGGDAVLVDLQGLGARWSFDSTRLLFITPEDGRGVWHVFDVRTGEATDLLEAGIWAYWLADGRVVHAGFRCGVNDMPRDVTVVEPATGDVEVLTQTPDQAEVEGVVSPAGDRLVYFRLGAEPDSPRSLELIDFATGDRETLATGVGPAEPFHVHEGDWSPDGRYLRFGYGFAHGICD